jgi:hypothetical protein
VGWCQTVAMTVYDGGGEAAAPRPVIGGAFGLLPGHPSISWAAGTRYDTDGWDAATAEAFADRVLAEAELHVPGLAVRVVLVGGALQ